MSTIISHELAPIIFSLTALVFSFLALTVRIFSYKQQKDVITRHEEMNFISLFNDSNKKLRDIQSQLPNAVNDPNWLPEDNHKRLINIYWYTVFDVWAITNKFSHGTKALWNDYYLNGVKSALKIPAFVEVFNEMKEVSGFMGHKDDFIKEIQDVQKIDKN